MYKKEHGKTGISLAGGNKTGVYISGVEGGGPAQRAGIREGDFIIQVGTTCPYEKRLKLFFEIKRFFVINPGINNHFSKQGKR